MSEKRRLGEIGSERGDPLLARGRSSRSNEAGRFERLQTEVFDDGWSGSEDDEPSRVETTVTAEKAKTITAYTIQVKGYASSVGSASLNQKLSEDRANSVTQFLQQQGHVPLTNMLAPGAMGESRQVGSDTKAEGQAQNRRVVVRVLQNKGIAGT